MAGEEAWIAVIRRGGCTFNEKIRNVLALNASGVLIYDNEGSSGEPQPFNLGSKSPHKITIYTIYYVQYFYKTITLLIWVR